MPRKTKRPTKAAEASYDWPSLLRQIPGYDPYAQAGDCRFVPQEAERAIRFAARHCRHVEGERAGQPVILEDWQKAIVGNLFGWQRPDGTRRYREAFVLIPRKNGKSTLAAIIVLYSLYCDGEAGNQTISAAADRDQAALVYGIGRRMVEQDAELSRHAKIYSASKTIVIESQGSFWRAISAEAGTKHGLNPHIVIYDELHAAPDRELVDVLATGQGARRQPLFVSITTADYDRPSICNDKYKYAQAVRDNQGEPDKPGHDPSFLPVIYEAPQAADWTAETVWHTANPNLGISVSLDYLRRECQRAKEEPSFENTFRRLHLNQRTEQAQRWLQLEQWDKCGHDPEPLDGAECYAGLDLSTTTDFSALVLYFPATKGIIPFFWIPADTAKRRETRDRIPAPLWATQGHVYLTGGNVVDYEQIRATVQELGKKHRIKAIAYDPWNATQLAQTLQDVDGYKMIEFRQGFKSMNEPAKAFERMIVSTELRHYRNPCLRWMVSNVSASSDPAGNIKPDKAKSTGRIDGVVAAIMGIGLAGTAPTARTSVYESRGVLTL